MNNLITQFEEINMEDESNLSTRSNDQQILCFTKNTSTQIAISNSSQSA